MPDGDIVHPTLSARYNSVYKQLCDGAFDEGALAHEALLCLKKDLQAFGDAPIHLIFQEADLFTAIAIRMQNGQEINWAQERRNILELKRFVDGPKRALGLVVKTCEQQILLLQKEQQYVGMVSDFSLEIMKGYLTNVYDAQFAKKAAQTRGLYRPVDLHTLQQTLGEMRPHVLRGIHFFAEQVLHKGTMQQLRRPRRAPIKKIDLEQDLNRDLSDLLR
ncbi:hypothetical protein KSF_089200 [Reticulibacter mediterranei]|uniref:Uncharacterized protein n=1 Tax=Reticulibacter mediterranei TaxID=2778369 RepID=A0A8J3N536_9CHLR|nr:hypothetical protein [Reticulibacter mediterranei]GHO98872.1 hypothetical protein KSF_089200 [Reticulibacter mediterranei]